MKNKISKITIHNTFKTRQKCFYGHPLKCYVSCGGIAQPCTNPWECFSHGSRGHSHFHLQSFSILISITSWSVIPIPTGVSWDFHSHWEFHSNGHFYSFSSIDRRLYESMAGSFPTGNYDSVIQSNPIIPAWYAPTRGCVPLPTVTCYQSHVCMMVAQSRNTVNRNCKLTGTQHRQSQGNARKAKEW